ncbi:MAG TPA: cupredoxin family copper-binding protein [Candidatus Saccharimonadales bacterium]|nr:cupredoxin family copper-binding protein [Candidatus Saccharimonadales bacterium]
MRNRVLVLLLTVIVIAVAAWAIFGSGGNKDNNGSNTNSSTSSQTNNSNNNSSSTPVATNKVSIANMAFSPADITVKKGTTVTWTNNDSIEHTVTENDGKNGPSAPPLASGKSYSFTFNETGTFNYHCSIHPEMTGSVTVTD